MILGHHRKGYLHGIAALWKVSISTPRKKVEPFLPVGRHLVLSSVPVLLSAQILCSISGHQEQSHPICVVFSI